MKNLIKGLSTQKRVLGAVPLLVLAAGCSRPNAPEAVTELVPPPSLSTIPKQELGSKGLEEPIPSQEPDGGYWTSLAGEFGSDSRWGSGRLDLLTSRTFAKGEQLRLRIGGSAKRVLVRLLPKGVSFDKSQGLLGGVVTVPDDDFLILTIDTDRKNVAQISVHGKDAWNMIPGQPNGPATLEAVDVWSSY